MKKVKEIQHFVRMKCEGCEDQFMALLIAIEVDQGQIKKFDSKKKKELKRLEWSINEDSASRENLKGRGFCFFLIKPKIVSWNIRGLNETNKRSQIKNLLQEWKPDIVCFQETKLKFISRRLIQSLWSCPYVYWIYLALYGASRGVLLM